ncbi:MAG: tetratricopeptide repeat protein [Treponema sp.]|jgi:tetratricopeptide (TPR) repeat protein|nr:tetratricopeptide repeat protein [Treponema sp.]
MKSRIIFIPVPESLREQLEDGALFDFPIDPDIPFPVKIYEDNENETLENLSVEAILSGMLQVIKEGKVEQEWLDYYTGFVLYLRPDILTTIKEIKDNGLDDENFINAHNLIQEGKTEEGLACIRDFIEVRPKVWNGWFVLGWALRLLGRWEDGKAALKKAIELGGGNSDTRNELAICLMETGDTAGAKRELESALTSDPENVKIISNLGVLAIKNNEPEKAAAFFRTVLEIDNSDPVAKSYLGMQD